MSIEAICFPQWEKENWNDCSSNPVIANFVTDKGGAVIGDPQIILPEEFDGKWHCFCHGFYVVAGSSGYFHFISDDGIHWEHYKTYDIAVGPSFIFHDDDKFILYTTECVKDEEWNKYKCNNHIMARTSKNLDSWSNPVEILRPELSWEREMTKDVCELFEARNPCVIKLKNGKYRLYYSAGTVYLNKCGFEEPKYISFAESDSPMGPFKKYGKPIISPNMDLWYRNLGAGAIKVFGWDDKYLAFYNSIYTDEKDYQHSAINVLVSNDGISFKEAPYNPIILPSNKEDWKKAFVYQLDAVRYKDEIRVYYNSRDDWKNGKEQIGMSYIKDNITNIKKL